MRSLRGIVIILAVGLFGVVALSCGSSVEQHPATSSGTGGGGGSTTSTSGTGGSAGSAGGAVGGGGAAACGGEAMVAGFVVGTTIPPEHPTPDVDDYILSGMLSYQGPITQPIATNPAFNQEIQIEHGVGDPSIVQYFLPDGYALPLTLNNPYTVIFRRRNGFEGYAVGVVITRPTSGLPPLLFVFEGGEYGRALEEEDPHMAPLKVFDHDDPSCPIEPGDGCGDIHRHFLRFDSSTGGAATELDLYQAETGTLPVLGNDFQMVNLASTRILPGCPDGANGRTSFMAINQEP